MSENIDMMQGINRRKFSENLLIIIDLYDDLNYNERVSLYMPKGKNIYGGN